MSPQFNLTTLTFGSDTLVERCLSGDPQAQRALYHRYLRAMYRVALRITGDEMEAEDVLQEAFVRAFRNLHSYKGDATFGAWLKRIVINTAINHLKKRRTEVVGLEHVAAEPGVEEPQAASPLSMAQISEAIDQLPEGYRNVFSLYLLEGYDHKEIGSILNISEATSKSQYSRARRKLREILAVQWPGAGNYRASVAVH
ncbi:MAG: RNA polymerase sigma factor [Bacteroidia bacterium]